MQNDLSRLTIGQAAKFLGVSIDTLRRWQKKGKAKSYRSPGGHRYFFKQDLKKLFKIKQHRSVIPNINPITNKVPEKQTISPIPVKAVTQIKKPFPSPQTKKRAKFQLVAILLFVLFIIIDAILIYYYFHSNNVLVSPLSTFEVILLG